MTQTNFLESAKMGDPRVIAGLLNRSLQSQGITTKATRRNNELHLLLEGASLQGKQDSIVEYLVQALSRLQVPASTVSIYAKVPGQEDPVWRHSLQYEGPEQVGLPTMPSNFTLSVPETAEPEMTPHPQSEDDFGSSEFGSVALDEVEADVTETIDQDPQFGSITDDFLDHAAQMDTLQQDSHKEFDSFELSASPSNGYLDAEEPNGQAWHTEAAEDNLYADALPEEPLPRSGFPVLPLSLAAIVALLFAGAGFYYRLVLFPNTAEVPVPTEVTTNLPPESVPSLPPILPGDTSPEVPEAIVTPDPLGLPSETLPSDPANPEIPADGTVNPTTAWRDAINAAQDAAVKAQTAQTPEDWAIVAQTWDQSIQLLLAVPETDPNYARAQEKVVEYTENMDIARLKEERALSGQ